MWGSGRGLGIPQDTPQTPPKHPRYSHQTPLKAPLRHLPHPSEIDYQTPLDTPQTPLRPHPHPSLTSPRHPSHPSQTPTRHSPDPSQTQPSQTPPQTHPRHLADTPSETTQTTPRYPGPPFRVPAKTDWARSLAALAKLLDTQGWPICQIEATVQPYHLKHVLIH